MQLLPGLEGAFEGMAKMADQPPGLSPAEARDAAYAQRLRDAGVAVEERCWEGQFHGSMQLAKLIPDEAAAYHDQVVTALRRAFGTA